MLRLEETDGIGLRLSRYSLVSNEIENAANRPETRVEQGGFLQFKLVGAVTGPGTAAAAQHRHPEPLLRWKALEWRTLDPEFALKWGSESFDSPPFLQSTINLSLSRADADFFMPRGSGDAEGKIRDAPPSLRCHAVAVDYVQLPEGASLQYEVNRSAIQKLVGAEPRLVMDQDGQSVVAFIRQAVAERAVVVSAGPATLNPRELDAAYQAVFAAIREAWLDYDLLNPSANGPAVPTVKERDPAAKLPDAIQGKLWGWVAVERYRPVELQQASNRWVGRWIKQDDFLREIEQRLVFFLVGDWSATKIIAIGMDVELSDPSVKFGPSRKKLVIPVGEVIGKGSEPLWEWKTKGRSSLCLKLRWRFSSLKLKNGTLITVPAASGGAVPSEPTTAKWNEAHIAAYQDAIYLWPDQLRDLLAQPKNAAVSEPVPASSSGSGKERK